MKNNNKNIEDLFKQSFDNYKLEPDTKTWSNISNALKVRQFFGFNAQKFNIYYLAAILFIISTITFLFSNNNVTQQAISIAQHKIKSPIHIRSVSTNTNQNVMNKNKTHRDFVKPKNITGNNVSPIKKQVINNKSNNTATKLIHRNIVSTVVITDSLSKDINKLKLPVPKPLFKLNTRKGCVPLKIEIENYTKFAENYEWSFGNGEKSEQENPVYTYTKAGIYTVMLIAKGVGGSAASYVDSVVVYNKPENNIEISEQSQLSENENFRVSVDNKNSTKHKWYFGDGNTSTNHTAIHKYEKEGVYSISLASTTKNNCYDSVLLENIIVMKYPNKIVFPNAFCPNLGGSSNGKYSHIELHNNVFHPIIVGTVEKYELKIYAKTGVVVFETKDVNTGWDGYYNNKLMPEGVYPYVVTVKFEGDNKPIQKRSNITILYKTNR